MRPPKPILMFVIFVSALGCAIRAATTEPATTRAAERIVRLRDAVPIGRFRTAEQDVDLRNRISYSKRGELYFGQADVYDDNGDVKATQPLVVSGGKGGWNALSLKDERLENAEWQLVASGPADDEIWGVLDDSLNHRGKVILLAHSRDAGTTWAITTVNKPFGAGDYDSFSMSAEGHGRLSVYVEPEKKHPGRAGFYHFRTRDGGKTWGKPEHEPDALDPAEEIPEDEDPEPLKETPVQNVSAPHHIGQRASS